MKRVAKRVQIRQGDVLLTPVGEPTPGAVNRALDARKKPLAGLRVEGERSGHVHELPARVYERPDGARLLFLERPTVMTHQDHEHVEVPAGWWEVTPSQREYVDPERNAQRYD